MNKIAILFFGISLTVVSCTKDYTCTCKYSNTGSTNTETSTTTFKGVTKSFVKNKAECVSRERKNEKGETTSKRECTID